ncbi:MAG: hypothetical protein AB7I19_11590 [Planctomycetota bacterium]
MRTTTATVSLLAALLLADSGAAQSSICQAISDNPIYADNTSMGGPNLQVGFKVVASTVLVVSRLEIFTGEATGTNSIGIWSDDAANNRPLASLGSSSWSMSRINGWQGANFSTPIVILPGTTFWLVWAPINGAQSSIEVGSGGTTVYRGSFDGGQTWNGPFQGPLWKYRIWCGGQPGQYETYGAGCAGTTRRVPVLGFADVPTLGQSTSLLLQSAVGATNAFVSVGISDQFSGGSPLPLDLGVVGAPGCFVLASLEMTMAAAVGPAGDASATLPIPALASLVGAQFFDQWLVLMPGANTLSLLVSNAGRGTIGD